MTDYEYTDYIVQTVNPTRTLNTGDLIRSSDLGGTDPNRVVGIYLGDNQMATLGSGAFTINPEFSIPVRPASAMASGYYQTAGSPSWAVTSHPTFDYESCKAYLQSQINTFLMRLSHEVGNLTKEDEVTDFNDGVSSALTTIEALKDEFQRELTEKQVELLHKIKTVHENDNPRKNPDEIDIHDLSIRWESIFYSKVQVLESRLLNQFRTHGISMMTRDYLDSTIRSVFGDLVTIYSAEQNVETSPLSHLGLPAYTANRSVLQLTLQDYRGMKYVLRVY